MTVALVHRPSFYGFLSVNRLSKSLVLSGRPNSGFALVLRTSPRRAPAFQVNFEIRNIAQSAGEESAVRLFQRAVGLSQGIGVAQDLVAAARYFKLSADCNFAPAQHEYGLCLWFGRGVGVDPLGRRDISNWRLIKTML